ncbi:MAG: aminoacyl-tRNA hydrolase [Acidobacteriota bacterium]|nr:aminoacyl-tRNA hydrolase [Acidobacteriota bacterium]
MNGEPQAEPRQRLVLGLGNPGERYARTRHNVGFRVVEELARRRDLRLGKLECNALSAADPVVMLAQPQTYMNRSGYALRCLAERHGFEAEDVLVVYDEVALPLGKLRLRVQGSPGGHRGMESVIENVRTDEVARLRCGIQHGGIADEEAEDDLDLVAFVLAEFTAEEESAVKEMILRAADACEAWLADGATVAMNQFNR